MSPVITKKDPALLAKELNQFVTDSGGQPIQGLENVDPAQLVKIRDGLKQFLDNFDAAKAQDPELANLADSEGVKSLRSLAQLASAKVDENNANGLGPDAGQVAPIDPNGAATTTTGADGAIQLSDQDTLSGMKQIEDLKGQVDLQKNQNLQMRVALNQDITALSNKDRTPAEDALLQGKQMQFRVLEQADKNLDLKKQGLDAASVALSDGVVTPSELQDLQTIAHAVQGKDVQIAQMSQQINATVGRLQALNGPVASNGSNFDPMSSNAVQNAAILSSALRGQGGQAGVVAQNNVLANLMARGQSVSPQQLAALGLGNLQSAGVSPQQLAALGLGNNGQNVGGVLQALGLGNNNQIAVGVPGSLSGPSVIGSDDSLGTDLNLASLNSVGGGGGFFEDRVFAIMCKVVEDFQKQIEDRLQKLQDEAKQAESQQSGGGGGGGGGKGGGIGGIIGGVAGSVVGGPIGGMIGSKLGGAVGGAVGGGGGGGGDSSGGSGGNGSANGSESRNIEFEKIKYDMQKLSQMQQAMSNILNSMDELAMNAIRHIKGG